MLAKQTQAIVESPNLVTGRLVASHEYEKLAIWCPLTTATRVRGTPIVEQLMKVGAVRRHLPGPTVLEKPHRFAVGRPTEPIDPAATHAGQSSNSCSIASNQVYVA